MRRLFADTSYWIALIDSRDKYYETAKNLSSNLNAVSIFTTNLVLVEFLNTFSSRGDYTRLISVKLVEEIISSKDLNVVTVDELLFEKSCVLYKQYKDKKWSLTDCVSFVVMKDENIEEALSADKHFIQAGFKILL